jgi:hypothetical protein
MGYILSPCLKKQNNGRAAGVVQVVRALNKCEALSSNPSTAKKKKKKQAKRQANNKHTKGKKCEVFSWFICVCMCVCVLLALNSGLAQEMFS